MKGKFKVDKCFSEFNPDLNANLRSYFDRWRDLEDDTGQKYTSMYVKPAWRLQLKSPTPATPPLKSVCNHNLTKTTLSRVLAPTKVPVVKRPPWNAEHHVLFSRSNHLFHRNYREYFDLTKPVE